MIISNSNYCTDWSLIQGVIARVISKLAGGLSPKANYKLQVRLLSELRNTKSNY